MGNNADARTNALARNSIRVIDETESARFRARDAGRRPIANSAPCPTFLYIGTPKSASTWIYDALREHPSVFIPIGGKSVDFFDYQYDRGWDWYLRQFRQAGMASAVGEVSHDYYLSEEAARRIRTHLPEVRLICCLREPGDFAVSWLRWCHSHTRLFGSTFAEIAEHPRFAQVLAYRKNLEAYFRHFRHDQILVTYYEDLRADPRSFVRELYRFVGIDPNYQPDVLSRRSNPTREPRSRMLLILVVSVVEFLRTRGAANFVGRFMLKDTLLHRFLYRNAANGEDASQRAELDRIAARVRAQMAGELDDLARLIGKQLPAQWLSAASGR